MIYIEFIFLILCHTFENIQRQICLQKCSTKIVTQTLVDYVSGLLRAPFFSGSLTHKTGRCCALSHAYAAHSSKIFDKKRKTRENSQFSQKSAKVLQLLL
jgi:hypothetical protein